MDGNVNERGLGRRRGSLFGAWTSQVQEDNEIACLFSENYPARPCSAKQPSCLACELG